MEDEGVCVLMVKVGMCMQYKPPMRLSFASFQKQTTHVPLPYKDVATQPLTDAKMKR